MAVLSLQSRQVWIVIIHRRRTKCRMQPDPMPTIACNHDTQSPKILTYFMANTAPALPILRQLYPPVIFVLRQFCSWKTGQLAIFPFRWFRVAAVVLAWCLVGSALGCSQLRVFYLSALFILPFDICGSPSSKKPCQSGQQRQGHYTTSNATSDRACV